MAATATNAAKLIGKKEVPRLPYERCSNLPTLQNLSHLSTVEEFNQSHFVAVKATNMKSESKPAASPQRRFAC